MPLTPEDIQSFIEMWKRAFGELLTPEAARSEVERLINFFLVLAEESMELAGLKPEGGSDDLEF